MANGKPFVAVLGAVIILEVICCCLAFPVQAFSSTSTGDKYFNCFEDACLIGRDYCDIFHQRCALCSDVETECFTNRQQQNCTQFCMDDWIKEHQPNSGSQNNDCVWKYGVIVESSLLLMALIFIIYMLRSRLKSCFGRCNRNPEGGAVNAMIPNGADLSKVDSDKTPLAPDAPVNGQVDPRQELRSTIRYHSS